MDKLGLVCILPVPFVLLMVHRIHCWVLDSEPKSPRRKNAWLHILKFFIYSAFCWIPVLTNKPVHSDLPSIDIVSPLLILGWIVIFFVHLISYWLTTEIARSRERKKIAAEKKAHV